MSGPTSMVKCLVAGSVLVGALIGCSTKDQAGPAGSPEPSGGGFHSADCNGVTDADVTKAVGSSMFTKVVVSDTGCFWQENTVLGTFGAGMGISTWWYRGSDLDAERMLEQRAGRSLTELSIDGNKGFTASDDNVCSIYVAKGGDVIAWSIQSMNPAMLPDLCTITGQLARLSQDRVN